MNSYLSDYNRKHFKRNDLVQIMPETSHFHTEKMYLASGVNRDGEMILVSRTSASTIHISRDQLEHYNASATGNEDLVASHALTFGDCVISNETGCGAPLVVAYYKDTTQLYAVFDATTYQRSYKDEKSLCHCLGTETDRAAEAFVSGSLSQFRIGDTVRVFNRKGFHTGTFTIFKLKRDKVVVSPDSGGRPYAVKPNRLRILKWGGGTVDLESFVIQ